MTKRVGGFILTFVKATVIQFFIIIESCVTVDFTNVIMRFPTPLVIPCSYVGVHYNTIFVASVIVWLSTPPVAKQSARLINPLPA